MIDRRTLQNPLLYTKAVRTIRKYNPDFDEQELDRNLEYGEAIGDLERKGRIKLGRGYNPMKEYQEALFDMGIKHPRVQRFVMRQEPPARQDDLDLLMYVLSSRPEKNWKLDIARKAKKAKSVRQYAKNPNRYDMPGLDSPGSIYNADWMQ